MQIGKRLRDLRQVRGLSQGDLEKSTGLLRCYISRIEGGHTIPSLETLEKLAEALKIEMYQLFYTGGKPRAPKLRSAASRPRMAPEEKTLLDGYRELDAPDRKLLLSFVRKLVAMKRDQ